ncbi:hypothetical protein [Pedobacter chinensis]|uniref:hypothetical protein n=1 Tax=Pedobacter chinensis TaxID=2282421 RepID=UPI0013141382|nr:hypothetical protein [Pedobacter chinensis]
MSTPKNEFDKNTSMGFASDEASFDKNTSMGRNEEQSLNAQDDVQSDDAEPQDS